MNDVMISVIITTYRREMPVLKRAIESVYNQTYKNIELILVNDYPPNKEVIMDLIVDYESILFIDNGENIGACASRNKGINASKGKYIALLDDDDEWFPDKIEKQVKSAEDKYADMVYCGGFYCYKNGIMVKSPFIHDVGEYPIAELLKGNCMGGCSFPLIRKSIFNEVGLFDVSFPSSQDYEMWIRITQKGKIVFINEELVKYYVLDESITANIDKRLAGYELLLNKHKKVFETLPKSASFYIKNMIANAFANKRYKKTLQYILISFAHAPYNIECILYPLIIIFSKLKKRFCDKVDFQL